MQGLCGWGSSHRYSHAYEELMHDINDWLGLLVAEPFKKEIQKVMPRCGKCLNMMDGHVETTIALPPT